MESYISDARKDFLGNQFYNLHATFARPITIYKTAQETVLVENPDNNYLYAAAPFNTTTTKVVQSGVFGVRILYGKRETISPFASSNGTQGGASQNIIRLSEGEVRFKLDPTGAAFIQGCERVTCDGTIFNLITDKRPHGLFNPKFETYYLKKVQ